VKGGGEAGVWWRHIVEKVSLNTKTWKLGRRRTIKHLHRGPGN